MYELFLIVVGVVAGFVLGGVASLWWMKDRINKATLLCNQMNANFNQLYAKYEQLLDRLNKLANPYK